MYASPEYPLFILRSAASLKGQDGTKPYHSVPCESKTPLDTSLDGRLFRYFLSPNVTEKYG